MDQPDLEHSSTSNDGLRKSIEMGVLVLLMVVFVAVSLWRQTIGGIGKNPFDSIGIIVAAGLTLVMYSFLYRDNPLFKIAENLYVGITLGYGAVMTWRQACARRCSTRFSAPPPPLFSTTPCCTVHSRSFWVSCWSPGSRESTAGSAATPTRS